MRESMILSWSNMIPMVSNNDAEFSLLLFQLSTVGRSRCLLNIHHGGGFDSKAGDQIYKAIKSRNFSGARQVQKWICHFCTFQHIILSLRKGIVLTLCRCNFHRSKIPSSPLSKLTGLAPLFDSFLETGLYARDSFPQIS